MRGVFDVICVICVLVLLGGGPAFGSERVNVVLILADDLGVGDLGCFNAESRIPTPALDRLASEGARFTDAHSPSAVCTPTRYALLTGRYAWRTRLERGVLGGDSPALIEPGRPTIASVLRGAGYATACFGKWHLGMGAGERADFGGALVPGPNAAGFDEFYGIPASLDMAPYVYVHNERVVEAPTETIEASGQRRSGGGGFWREGAIAPGFRHADVLPVTIDRALAYVRERGGAGGGGADDRPFFLYVALSAPHTPWLPSGAHAGVSGAGAYGDFVAQVDDGIGRLVDAVDRFAGAEQTLLIVTSDNGAHWTPKDIERFGHLANKGYRGQKADIHEGGHRVPLIVRWPGRVRAGAVSDATVCLVDLGATCAAAVGAGLPADFGSDGVSFLWALTGEAAPGSDRAIVHHSFDGMFAVRVGDWKLVEGLGSGGFTAPKRVEPEDGGPAGQLYNLFEDPGERRDVYAQRPEVVRRLTEALEMVRSGE